MTLYCFGSINLDHFYAVPHLPQPGETLLASGHHTGLGGKGANMSVAAAQAGAEVVHIGAVGPDGAWAVSRLKALGVNTDHITETNQPTAHAIINIDPSAENAIVVFPGANMEQSLTRLKTALKDAEKGDMLLLQNETNLQAEAAAFAKSKDMRVLYAAAPFNAEATAQVLPHTDILILNEVELAQLQAASSFKPSDVETLIVTEGSKGGHALHKDTSIFYPAFPVTAVDTTGAGDTFTGYTAAALAEGQPLEAALRLAAAASALKVTRKGTADAIPCRQDVETFLKAQPSSSD